MTIFTIADIHFGIGDDERKYKELYDNFITKVNKDKPDIIVIAGDSFDKRVTLDSDAAIYFNKFIHELVKTDSVIILINGTYSHDRHQINSVSHFVSNKFFIVYKVTELDVLGLKLLILPEEYVYDQTYYDKYLSKKYDFVFGHGLFKHNAFGANNKLGHLNRKSYVFDYKQFEKIVKYYVSFGHIHIHSVYKNKIISVGSFSRNSFGEEDPKGFIKFIIKNNKCEYEFIENKDAPSYVSVNALMLAEETDEILKQLRDLYEKNDYLRIIIDSEVNDNKQNNILGFAKNHPNTMILKKSNQTSIEKIEKLMNDRQEHIIEELNKYKGLSFIEITQQISKDKFHEIFTTEDIQDVLNKKI